MPMSVLASIVLALLVGGGVSLASNSSLPGDALYPVKINVNEAVKQSLALSTKAKANVNADLAIRRLEEAEEVAVDAHLDADVLAKIESNFKRHADKVEARVEEMASKDAHASADLMARFETSLRAHERILSALQDKAEDQAEVSALVGLNASVKAELQDSVKASDEADAKVSGGSNADVQVAAEARMAVARREIDAMQKLFDSKKASMSASAIADAEARLSMARTHFAEGEASLQSKAFATAFMHFSEASKSALEANVLLRAHNNLKVEVEDDDEDVKGIELKVNGASGAKLNY